MPVHRLTDLSDPALVDYTGLTDVALRRVREPAEGLYLAESTKVIRRALAAGHRPRSFLLTERWLPDLEPVVADVEARFGPVPVHVGPPELVETLTGFHLHRGALASMHRPVLPALEDVVDHTNVGAVFRSVAGIGADAVLVSPRCADPLYRRAVRVSMGTVFQVPWTRLEPWPAGLDAVRALGFTVAALTLADGAVDLDRLEAAPPPRLALVLGTEGDGLSAGAVAHADLAVRIPMRGDVDSLNVAAASAVAVWATRVREPFRP